MPRDHALINMGVWQDGDFRSLPPAAQHLYFTLWLHPGLSYCGVVDWRTGRVTGLSHGWRVEDVRRAAACLQARHFIVIDEVTEECLLRSWVRWDGLMKQPRMAVSYANAYGMVASNLLRGVIVDELVKLRDREPDLAGLSKPQVVEMLAQPRVSAKSLEPVEDPFAHGFTHGFGDGLRPGLGEAEGSARGSVSGSPTTATATATSLRAAATANEPPHDDAPSPTEIVMGDFGEWMDAAGQKRPPEAVRASLSRQVRNLLAEGIPAADIFAGLKAWQGKPHLGAAALPSVVHEVRSTPAKPRRQADTDDIFDKAANWAAEQDRKAIAR